jgi:hypothetical protein
VIVDLRVVQGFGMSWLVLIPSRHQVAGTAIPSFTSTLLEESLHPGAKIDEETVQNTAAMAYAGASLSPHPPIQVGSLPFAY